MSLKDGRGFSRPKPPTHVIFISEPCTRLTAGNVTNRAQAGTNRDSWDEAAAELGRNGGFGPHLDGAERLPNPILLE